MSRRNRKHSGASRHVRVIRVADTANSRVLVDDEAGQAEPGLAGEVLIRMVAAELRTARRGKMVVSFAAIYT